MGYRFAATGLHSGEFGGVGLDLRAGLTPCAHGDPADTWSYLEFGGPVRHVGAQAFDREVPKRVGGLLPLVPGSVGTSGSQSCGVEYRRAFE